MIITGIEPQKVRLSSLEAPKITALSRCYATCVVFKRGLALTLASLITFGRDLCIPNSYNMWRSSRNFHEQLRAFALRR